MDLVLAFGGRHGGKETLRSYDKEIVRITAIVAIFFSALDRGVARRIR